MNSCAVALLEVGSLNVTNDEASELSYCWVLVVPEKLGDFNQIIVSGRQS